MMSASARREARAPRALLSLLIVAGMAILSIPAADAGCPLKFLSGGSGDAPRDAAHSALSAAPQLVTDGARARRSLLAVQTPAHKVDYAAVMHDIRDLLTDSQAFWPADFGNYGPFFIRLAWHCSGTYRTWDGRGGCDGGRQRFAPELSWGDNTNLDKAHTLLQNIKLKYGPGLSWGDLFVMAGTTAIESMGGPVLGFCGGRIDDADGAASVPLGPSAIQEALTPCPVNGNCSAPMGQTFIGDIYVDPAGHMGNPVLMAETINDIRGTFGRMGMNDSETVALIGAHAFGKAHGACPTGPGPSPEQDPYNPYPGTCGSGPNMGKGNNTFTSGFEGMWTEVPTLWSSDYFNNLLDYDWVLRKSPADKPQWEPVAKSGSSSSAVPNIFMLTTDLALTKDPKYLELVKLFASDMKALNAAFSTAWYKLVTRDMGPVSRCLGRSVPPAQPFQNPLPRPTGNTPNFDKVKAAIRKLIWVNNSAVLAPDTTGPSKSAYYGALFSELAWRCAATFRATDYQGGCNGAQIRFSPQKDWPINVALDKVQALLAGVRSQFPKLTWADLIVLAGQTAAEEANGPKMKFCGGRVDALDGGPTAMLAPRSIRDAILQVQDDAAVAGLTLREAVALAGRLRSPSQQVRLGFSGSYNAELPSLLSNDYFAKLVKYTWAPHNSSKGVAEFTATKTDGTVMYMTPSDVAIRAAPQMLAVAQEYASDNALFKKEFAAAWTKMMNADRFDGPSGSLCSP